MVTLEAPELREGGVAVPVCHLTFAVTTLVHQGNPCSKAVGAIKDHMCV